MSFLASRLLGDSTASPLEMASTAVMALFETSDQVSSEYITWCDNFFQLYEKSVVEHNLLSKSIKELKLNIRKDLMQEADHHPAFFNTNFYANHLLTHCLLHGITGGSVAKCSYSIENDTSDAQEDNILSFECENNSGCEWSDDSDSDNDNDAVAEKLNVLNQRIQLYTNLINKYPSLQFLTTFYRYLPHIYGKILLSTNNMHSLMLPKDENIKMGSMQMNSVFKDIMIEIYDMYAGFTDIITKKTKDKHDKDNDCKSNNAESQTDEESTKITATREMNIADLQHYIVSCDVGKSSANVQRCTDICRYNNNKSTNVTTLTKDGFLKWYTKAAMNRPKAVINDIEKQGFLTRLINPIIDENNPLNKDVLFQRKKQYIEQIEQRFIDSEWILIHCMIKKGKMLSTFNRLNNDIKNIIFEHLHPMELTNNCYDTASYDFASKIRNFYVLSSRDEETIDRRLEKRFFYDLALNRMKQINIDENVEEEIRHHLSGLTTLDQFCDLTNCISISS